ncbi:MAG: hypothetical protein ACR2OZ_18565 [Verrucomicrobiales bacterium]
MKMSLHKWFVAIVGLWVLTSEARASDPAWWSAPATTIWSTPEGPYALDHEAPINVGQLKHVMWQAAMYFQNVLQARGGAGHDILFNHYFTSSSDDTAVANVGQLKWAAAPFYGRLHDLGLDVRPGLLAHVASSEVTAFSQQLDQQAPPRLPWNPAAPPGENSAPATVGQLKLAFCFDLDAPLAFDQTDANSNGIADGQERWDDALLPPEEEPGAEPLPLPLAAVHDPLFEAHLELEQPGKHFLCWTPQIYHQYQIEISDDLVNWSLESTFYAWDDDNIRYHFLTVDPAQTSGGSQFPPSKTPVFFALRSLESQWFATWVGADGLEYAAAVSPVPAGASPLQLHDSGDYRLTILIMPPAPIGTHIAGSTELPQQETLRLFALESIIEDLDEPPTNPTAPVATSGTKRFWRVRRIADSDGDGINDATEISVLHSDPFLVDTDGDGIDDRTENDQGNSPLNPSDANQAQFALNWQSFDSYWVSPIGFQSGNPTINPQPFYRKISETVQVSIKRDESLVFPTFTKLTTTRQSVEGSWVDQILDEGALIFSPAGPEDFKLRMQRDFSFRQGYAAPSTQTGRLTDHFTLHPETWNQNLAFGSYSRHQGDNTMFYKHGSWDSVTGSGGSGPVEVFGPEDVTYDPEFASEYISANHEDFRPGNEILVTRDTESRSSNDIFAHLNSPGTNETAVWVTPTKHEITWEPFTPLGAGESYVNKRTIEFTDVVTYQQLRDNLVVAVNGLPMGSRNGSIHDNDDLVTGIASFSQNAPSEFGWGGSSLISRYSFKFRSTTQGSATAATAVHWTETFTPHDVPETPQDESLGGPETKLFVWNAPRGATESPARTVDPSIGKFSDGSGGIALGTTVVNALPQIEFFLDHQNQKIDPASQALGVSNWVTTTGLPKDSSFFDTCDDPKNFRITVVTADPPPALVDVNLKVIRDTSVVSNVFYTLTAHDGNRFRSRFLRLVSDAPDDSASEHGVSSDPNSQSIRVRLEDKVHLSYTLAGQTLESEIRVGRPASETNNSHPLKFDIRTAKVRFLVFRKSSANQPAATRAQIEEEIAIVNERYAQAATRIEAVGIEMGGAGDPGIQLPAAFADGFAHRNLESKLPSADERAAVSFLDGDLKTIDILVVEQLLDAQNDQQTGHAYAQRGLGGDLSTRNVVVVGGNRRVFTISHELLHILLGFPHRVDPLGGIQDPPTSLFFVPTSAANAVDATKRIGPNPDLLQRGIGQIDTQIVRNTAEVP